MNIEAWLSNLTKGDKVYIKKPSGKLYESAISHASRSLPIRIFIKHGKDHIGFSRVDGISISNLPEKTGLQIEKMTAANRDIFRHKRWRND